MDDIETKNRRARLRELIRECFNDTPADLLRHIEAKTGKMPNQGEMSAIQKDDSGKSFGDKKAKALTEQIGLSRRWFDMPTGTNINRQDWLTEVVEAQFHASKKVSPMRINTDPHIAEVIRLMEATDTTGRILALGGVKAALDKHTPEAQRKQAK